MSTSSNLLVYTEEDKAKLQKYKDKFNQYAKRRIFECPPEFGPVSDADHADIFVKLDAQYDDYTVAEIEVFRHKLSEILRVSSESALRLCRVEKGCIQLTFQMPTFLKQEIFPLSREQERALAAVSVIRLTCGEYQFLVNCIVTALLLLTVVLEVGMEDYYMCVVHGRRLHDCMDTLQST